MFKIFFVPPRLLSGCAVSSVLTTVININSYSAERKKNVQNSIIDSNLFEVSKQLKIGFDFVKSESYDKNNVKIVTPPYDKNINFPIRRVCRVLINAPLDEIASLWSNQDSRVAWDTGLVREVHLIKKLDENTSQIYLLGNIFFIDLLFLLLFTINHVVQ